MDQTMTYVKIMKESLIRKKKYLEEILHCTREQEELAHQKSFDEEAFGSLIDRKEVLINNVNEIDKGFTSVYDRVRGEVLADKDKYHDELVEMQKLIKECVDMGLNIETLEERNRATLEQIFSSGLKNLRQVKQSKKIANKYYQSMSNGGVNDTVFYDKKK